MNKAVSIRYFTVLCNLALAYQLTMVHGENFQVNTFVLKLVVVRRALCWDNMCLSAHLKK